MKEVDKIIIVADNIPKCLFKFKDRYLKDVVVWKIPDEQRKNKKNIKSIILGIKRRVDGLVRLK